MKKLLIIFAAAALAASCNSEPVENDFRESTTLEPPTAETPPATETDTVEAPGTVIEEPIIPNGSFSFQGQTPSKTSKIPTCKDGEPVIVHFDLLDSQGQHWTRESPVTEVNGFYVSEPDSLPIGNYELRYIYLMSRHLDTLFAVPTQEDTEVRDYVEGDIPESAQTPLANWADLILPLDLTITDIETIIEGTAFCEIPDNLPIPGELGSGINTGQLQTIPIYITGEEDKGGFTEDNGIYYPYMDLCVDYFTVTIDAYRVYERYTWSQFNQYHITAPVEYRFMDIRTYDLDSSNPNDIESRSFGSEGGREMYDPQIHGALIFDKCDPPAN